MRGRRHWAVGRAARWRFWSGALALGRGVSFCEMRLMALIGSGLCAGIGPVTMGLPSKDGGSVGIEHESLILAQNERWRHA
jgi:hypothetical protein